MPPPREKRFRATFSSAVAVTRPAPPDAVRPTGPRRRPGTALFPGSRQNSKRFNRWKPEPATRACQFNCGGNPTGGATRPRAPRGELDAESPRVLLSRRPYPRKLKGWSRRIGRGIEATPSPRKGERAAGHPRRSAGLGPLPRRGALGACGDGLTAGGGRPQGPTALVRGTWVLGARDIPREQLPSGRRSTRKLV